MTNMGKLIIGGLIAVLLAGAAFFYFLTTSENQMVGDALFSRPPSTAVVGVHHGTGVNPGSSAHPLGLSQSTPSSTSGSGTSTTVLSAPKPGAASVAGSIKTLPPPKEKIGQSSGAAATSTATSTVNTSTSASQAAPALPSVVTIDPGTIVGVLCYFNTLYTDEQTGQSVTGTQEEVRGSGVLISSRGDVLTNEHVVVQPEATTTVLDGNGNDVYVLGEYTLDHCDIGQIPAGDTIPTASEIQSINPFIQIPVLAYTAELAYVPPTKGLSDLEIGDADFAILHIDGLTPAAATFGVHALPKSFPYVKLLPVDQYSTGMVGDQVITYGYPGDVTSGQGNDFETFTMTGSVGHVTGIYGGDQFYNNVPLEIDTDMEIYHGRSGSPLFWRGYDVGIVTFFVGDNRTDSGSVAMDAVVKSLRGTQYWPQR